MKKNLISSDAQERGVALITSLLSMTMILALGIALVLSVTTDTRTTTIHRAGESAFYVADAGIGIARRAMTQALAEEIDRIKNGQAPFFRNNPPAGAGQFPDVQLIPTPDGTWNQAFYTRVLTRANALTIDATRDQMFQDMNGSSFTVAFNGPTGNVSLTTPNATSAIQNIDLLYSIDVTGRTLNGGSTVVSETGRLSTTVTLASAPTAGARSFAFSGFGAFFDNGDTQASAPLAAGIFSGPVHTNTHFAFLSSRSVTFRNVVSQVDNQIRYDNTSNTNPNRDRPPPNLTGITISTEGFKKVSAVPLPDNNFSQEFAVLNSTGVMDLDPITNQPVDRPGVIPTSGGTPVPVFDASGRVTPTILAANLRTVSNTVPTLNGSGQLPNGVYLPTADGSTISGSGIYVQGDAADIKVLADSSGNQVYVITQGSVVTTITSRYSSNQTTISSSAGGSRTYTGLFIDKTVPTPTPKNGTSLFVNGSINSLRGGKDSSTNRPGIASETALTITAQRHITVTGDLKYTDAVANSDGTPVTNINSIKNVLGIFSNDGNVKLAPVAANVAAGSSLGLEMNAAVISFNSNTSNDSGAIEGSIVYTGGTSPSSSARWKLVGSRVQSKINSIGYNNRDVFFDVRFSGGTFAPPFFPGTTYDLGPPVVSGVVTVTAVDTAAATAMSWFRNFK
jgi:Tfp pilus assembly protein PilX